jgi:NTP pyrophosphatase (non-canonical NTP hydrolase)
MEPMTVKDLINTSYEIADLKGFHEQSHPNFSEKLLLIVSEIIELQEADRKDKGEAAQLEELADIFIRLGDFCGIFYGALDVEDAIRKKHEKNRHRPYRHGCLY